MKKLFLVLTFVAFTWSAFACEISIWLDGKPITPNANINLALGSVHSLTVRFVPDHLNCSLKAEATIFMLGDEKWKTGKDYQLLSLGSPIVWKETAARVYETKIDFKAVKSGLTFLEIIRECSKGGYDEKIYFSIK